MTRSLLVKLEARNGESVRGFLLRCAEANYISQYSWINQIPEERLRLRKLIGQLLHGRIPTWLREKDEAEINPRSINKGHMLGNYARCCPECLAESPYWRFEWEHVYYVICHRHGRLLVGACPHCSRNLSWNRVRLTRCNCGSVMTGWSSISVPEPERLLCESLAKCLAADAGKMTELGDNNRLSALSEGLSTAELVTLIFTFGAYGKMPEASRKPGTYKVIDIAEVYDSVCLTVAMLDKWPSNFHSHLRDMGRYALPDAIKHEPPRHFLNFVKAIRTKFKSAALKFVLEEYQQFMRANWNGVMNNRHKWADRQNLDSQRYMTGASAASHLHIKLKQVKELVNKNILRGYIKQTPQGRDFVVVERDSLANAEKFFDDHLTVPGASILLGLPRGRVEELVNGGFLTLVVDPTSNRSRRFLSRKEIDAFVKRLSNGQREPEEEDLLRVSTILKTHLATEKEFHSFISSILVGQLSTVGNRHSAQGFSSLVIGRQDFYKWRSMLRARPSDIQFTVTQAAQQLGMKQEVAYHLVRSGLLQSTLGDMGKKKCHLIQLADLEKFKATYVSAVHLANSQKTSPKKIVKNFDARGIYPVAGPEVDSCRQYFFRQIDVGDVNLR